MPTRVSPPTRRIDVEPSLYERIGGDTVKHLVAAFYARVDHDPIIRRFYGKTLTCAIHALTDFMTTWLGGPSVYDLRGARLRRRHQPFAIDARARDAWLANMQAAIRAVGIPDAEAKLLLAHLKLGANALVNTGTTRKPVARSNGLDTRLSEQWDRLVEAEHLLDAISNGDLVLLQSLLPKRLVPHAELMRHALADRTKRVNPLDAIECLLANRDLDCNPDAGDDLGRYRHLQAMMEAYARGSPMIESDAPMHARFQKATHDRFIAEVERDPSCVQLRGTRGQTLLHDAAMCGSAELASTLVRSGADPAVSETEGHTPLYRAASGDVARVLLAAGATADVASGPTRGTPLHQAARHGHASVIQALLGYGATIDARDAKGETPLRRAVNCRKLEVVRLLIQHGADPHAADRCGITPLDAARGAAMRHALTADGT